VPAACHQARCDGASIFKQGECKGSGGGIRPQGGGASGGVTP
jgi:hypothetical protein